ncbi:MAG: outer membrane lipoprotein carrier protein LolA [Bacteroidetes bacterium]|nr:MAG: outer membrane lipoprotein carrier protein LolA [Bacteroidota bacterium]
MLAFAGSYGPDDKASQILQQSQTKMESLKDFSSSFTYSIAAPGSTKTATQSGRIKYKKGMYAIFLQDQEIYCDKVTQWAYIRSANEVNVMNNDPKESLSVENIFRIYRANGKPRYDGEEALHGATCHKVYIAITDPAFEYNQAYLWINKTTQLLEKAVLTDRRQNNTTYEFSEIRINLGLPDTDFRFQAAKHPGVKVFDER